MRRLPSRGHVLTFCFTAIVLLFVLRCWRDRVPAGEVVEGGSCEARCLARDPTCDDLFVKQGGAPGLEYATAERRARCRGLCVVVGASAANKSHVCLKN